MLPNLPSRDLHRPVNAAPPAWTQRRCRSTALPRAGQPGYRASPIRPERHRRIEAWSKKCTYLERLCIAAQLSTRVMSEDRGAERASTATEASSPRGWSADAGSRTSGSVVGGH
jgi:hypothetical protein